MTTEFRHKTVTTSFLVTPRRPEFVGAKLITSALLGAVLAVVMLVATLIGGGAHPGRPGRVVQRTWSARSRRWHRG